MILVTDRPSRHRLHLPDPGGAAAGRQGRRHGHRVRRRRQPDGLRLVGRGQLPDPAHLDHRDHLHSSPRWCWPTSRASRIRSGCSGSPSKKAAEKKVEDERAGEAEGRAREGAAAKAGSRRRHPPARPRPRRRCRPTTRRSSDAARHGARAAKATAKPEAPAKTTKDGAAAAPGEKPAEKPVKKPRRPPRPRARAPRPATRSGGAAARPIVDWSAMALPFTKVEGLGNDFVVVDLRPGRPARPRRPVARGPAVVRALCDRHFGVGADGVLAILPGDGRATRACGSSTPTAARPRCAATASAAWPRCSTRRTRPCAGRVLRIDTGAGRARVRDRGRRTARSHTVTVEMGRPRLTRARDPDDRPADDERARCASRSTPRDRTLPVHRGVDGQPARGHLRRRAGASLRALAESLRPGARDRRPRSRGAPTSSSPASAAGEIDLVVWERGCGITLACGTGACATVVAACLEERLRPGVETPVHLPGGTLFITVAPDYAGVRMRGPARSRAPDCRFGRVRRRREGGCAAAHTGRWNPGASALLEQLPCPATAGGGGTPRCS